jgi:hypothetical protein
VLLPDGSPDTFVELLAAVQHVHALVSGDSGAGCGCPLGGIEWVCVCVGGWWGERGAPGGDEGAESFQQRFLSMSCCIRRRDAAQLAILIGPRRQRALHGWCLSSAAGRGWRQPAAPPCPPLTLSAHASTRSLISAPPRCDPPGQHSRLGQQLCLLHASRYRPNRDPALGLPRQGLHLGRPVLQVLPHGTAYHACGWAGLVGCAGLGWVATGGLAAAAALLLVRVGTGSAAALVPALAAASERSRSHMAGVLTARAPRCTSHPPSDWFQLDHSVHSGYFRCAPERRCCARCECRLAGSGPGPCAARCGWGNWPAHHSAVRPHASFLSCCFTRACQRRRLVADKDHVFPGPYEREQRGANRGRRFFSLVHSSLASLTCVGGAAVGVRVPPPSLLRKPALAPPLPYAARLVHSVRSGPGRGPGLPNPGQGPGEGCAGPGERRLQRAMREACRVPTGWPCGPA